METYIGDEHMVDLPKQVLILAIHRERLEEVKLVFPGLADDTLWGILLQGRLRWRAKDRM